MKQEDDKLRSLLQDVFNDYEVTPEPGDWNRIAESLNQAKGRRRLIWIAWSAAAITLLLLTIYTGNEYFSNKSSIATTHQINTIASAKKNHTTAAKSQVAGNISTNQLTNENKILIKPLVAQTVSKNLKTEKVNSDEILLAINNKKQADKNQQQIANNQKLALSKELQVTNEPSLTKPNADKVLDTNPILASNDKKKDISIEKAKEQLAQEQLNALKENQETKKIKSTRAFILSGLALGNSSGFQPSSGSDQPMASNTLASSVASSMYLNSVKIYDLTNSSTPNISSYQNIARNFKPPITIALTATFSMGNKFSLESGFQYTNLQSNGQVTINSVNDIQFITYNTYNINEVLHYIGIPIIMNYTLSENKRLKTFISTGFTFEKGVQAYYKAVSRDDLPGAIKFTNHGSIKGLQESFSSGIGLSYSFIPHFELYIQPSLTYYFNTNNSNVTIYSTNPWLINLRSGIRYNFK